MSAVATWTPPALWSVPRDWPGERCFILCGGESLKAQRHLVPVLKGRIIAVKHGVLLRPDADVLFFAGERPAEIAPPLLDAFMPPVSRWTSQPSCPKPLPDRRLIVVRGKGHPVFPPFTKRIWRTTDHTRWSMTPTEVAGYDAGTSAINLAILFGSTEIVLLGYDMVGGRWFTGEIPHYLPNPIEKVVQQHMAPLPLLAADAKRKGIRIVNCSPISRVTCFERQPLEAFL